jgi:ribosomal-protein-alanine N-acetyltransferase
VSDASGLPLRTGRLLLRPLAAADLDAVLLVFGDARVSRFIGDGRLWDAAAAMSWLSRAQAHVAAHGFGSLAVVEVATGRTVGEAGLALLEGGPEVEVTYTLAHDAWGKGYATEAARAVLAWGFESVGLQRIVAVVSPENARSRRVIEKLGMRALGSARHYGAELLKYELTAGYRPGDGSSPAAAILEA